MDFVALAHECAPSIHVATLRALVNIESSFNPFAIGVVNGKLDRQPRNREEAVLTAAELERQGFNFSVGLAQVNKHNFKKYGLTLETAFNECGNLSAGARILEQCFDSAKPRFRTDQDALRGAFSCYYSGNFQTGFRPDFKGQPSYVDKIVGSALGVRLVTSMPARPIRATKTGRIAPGPQETASASPAPAAAGPKSAIIF